MIRCYGLPPTGTSGFSGVSGVTGVSGFYSATLFCIALALGAFLSEAGVSTGEFPS